MKKYLSLTAALLLLPGISSCNNDKQEDQPQKQTSNNNNNNNDDNTDDNTDDNSDDDTDDDDTDEDDLKCPEEDFNGCTTDSQGNTIVMYCIDDEILYAETCTGGKKCEMVLDEIDNEKYPECTIEIPNDLNAACSGAKTSGAQCTTVGNESWINYCDEGQVDNSIVTNCSAFDMTCGTFIDEGTSKITCKCTADTQCQNFIDPLYIPRNAEAVCDTDKGVCAWDCKDGYHYSVDSSGYGCVKNVELPAELTNACDNKADGYSACINAGNELYAVFCVDGQIYYDYTENCSAQGLDCGPVQYENGIFNECIAKLPEVVINACNGKEDDYSTCINDNGNSYLVTCADGQLDMEYSGNCTKYGYKCGPTEYMGMTYNDCVECTEETVKTDCKVNVANAHAVCYIGECYNVCDENYQLNADRTGCEKISTDDGCKTAADCGSIFLGTYACNSGKCEATCVNNATLGANGQCACVGDTHAQDGKCVANSDDSDKCDTVDDCGTMEYGQFACTGNKCIPSCVANASINANGICECDSDTTPQNGQCVKGDSPVTGSSHTVTFDFVDSTQSAFDSKHQSTVDNASIVVLGKGQMESGYVLTDQYVILNGKSGKSSITVSGIKGLTKISFDYIGWDNATIEITPDKGTKQTVTITKSEKDTATVNFTDAGEATSFVLAPTNSGSTNSRVVLDNLIWTDAK